jgi:hypothetical protein
MDGATIKKRNVVTLHSEERRQIVVIRHECRGNESSNMHAIEHNYVWAWRELSMRVTGHDKTELCVSDLPRV